MTVHLRCCKNFPACQINYEIGTSYTVCEKCFKLEHFSRGIKSKTEIKESEVVIL